MPAVVTLACPTCSAPLAVVPGTETLCCAFCRNTHRVDYQNGHIALAPLVERLGAMQSGVDRVAAELALPRLEREIRGLDEQLIELMGAHGDAFLPRTWGERYVLPIAIVWVVAILIATQFDTLLTSLLVFSFIYFLVQVIAVVQRRNDAGGKGTRDRKATLDAEIAVKYESVMHYRQLLDS